MTVPTGTLQTYTQVNIREDLINAIYNVDPYKTPILNAAKKTKATQSLHEWNEDALDAQNLGNAAIDGDDPTSQTLAPTTRRGNYTQISTKVVQISGRSQAVVAAGGSNKMGYQLLKKSKELKRDIEGILTYNSARAAGSSGAASKMAGLPCWLGSNTVFQTGGAPSSGANPASLDGTATRTYNSTKTALTETMLKSMAQLIFKNSGESPDGVYLSPTNKQTLSAFTGPGTRFTEVNGKKLATAIDVYETDFGNIPVYPDIFLAQSGDVFAISSQYLRIAYLRPFQTIPLAKTGDSDKKMLLVEYTMEVGNEKALGAIFDTNG